MVQVSTSILMVKEDNALKTFYNLETAKTDFFHIDVMDGKFVNNNTTKLMKDYALKIKHISNTPLDIHLMVEDVKEYVDEYLDLNPDRITFHIEAIKDKEKVLELIKYIKDNGVKVGISVKPNTDIEEIYDIIPYVHMVLIMTVEPGQGGQKLIEEMNNKIKKLKKFIDDNEYDIDIEADGGINDENAIELVNSGVNILVAGNYITSSTDYSDKIKKLKNI